MAAEKKGQTIVIKKITIVAGGHGGSWKVALADFMTALMAFFLVMWLLGQSAETKKAVSDYFSTPSLIEYRYQNFGATLTLEKLFLDFVNEPLKAISSFLEPADRNPNILDFGSEAVVTAFAADKMGDLAKNFTVSSDTIEFDIIDTELFLMGTGEPNSQYIKVMERLRSLVTGLQDGIVVIESRLFIQSVEGSDRLLAEKVANSRLDLVAAGVSSSFDHPTNELRKSANIQNKAGFLEGMSQRPRGLIHFSIRQKDRRSDGSDPKPMRTSKPVGSPRADLSLYENYVKEISEKKTTNK